MFWRDVWREVPLRAWFATLSLAAAGLVAVGYELQVLLRLAPCPLCIFQRLLYLTIAVLALGGFALPRARLLWGGLIALVGLFGFGVAGYQTWMQAFPELAKECSYSDPNAIEALVDWLGTQFPTLFMATGFCTSRDWEFLGMSMANWSVLCFAGFAAGAVLLMWVRRR